MSLSFLIKKTILQKTYPTKNNDLASRLSYSKLLSLIQNNCVDCDEIFNCNHINTNIKCNCTYDIIKQACDELDIIIDKKYGVCLKIIKEAKNNTDLIASAEGKIVSHSHITVIESESISQAKEDVIFRPANLDNSFHPDFEYPKPEDRTIEKARMKLALEIYNQSQFWQKSRRYLKRAENIIE